MTLASDISTTSTALSDIKQAIIAKGVTPSGNITTYATAISSIPSGGGSSEVACYVVQNGVASSRTTLQADSFSNITSIGDRALRYAYYYHSFEDNTVLNMSNVTSIGQQGMENSFYAAPGIVSVDLSSLTTVGTSGLRAAFNSIESLTAIDLSSLTTVGNAGLSAVCSSCENLSSVDLSSVQSIGSDGLSAAFEECNISSISFDSLSYIGDDGLSYAFQDNYNLSSVSFLALTSNSFEPDTDNNFFEDMLGDCENVTVHFPSNLQSVISSWSDVTNGFGGNNTTVLFDLPATE